MADIVCLIVAQSDARSIMQFATVDVLPIVGSSMTSAHMKSRYKSSSAIVSYILLSANVFVTVELSIFTIGI